MDGSAWEALRGIARGLHLAGYFTAFGTMFFRVVLLRGERVGGLTPLAWAGFAMAILAGAIWFLLQAADFSSAQNVSDLVAAVPIVLQYTRFGGLLLVRLAALVIAMLLLQFKRPHSAVLLAFTGVIAESWLGHGGAMTGREGAILLCASVPHLAAAAIWLGTLPALYLAVAQLQDAAPLVARYSPIGMLCVAALLLTALVQYVLLIGGPAAFFTSAYGAVALGKILLLGALIALAARNRARLLPALPASRQQLLYAICAEIGLGLLVLAAAGLLLQLEPPTMAGMT